MHKDILKEDLSDAPKPRPEHHLAFRVTDLDEVRKEIEGRDAEVLMPLSEADNVYVICAIIASRCKVFELVAAASEEARKKQVLTALRPRAIGHIAHLSDDIAADPEDLKQKGGEVRLPSTFSTGLDREMAFVQMPTALIIELMEPEAKGKPAHGPAGAISSVAIIAAEGPASAASAACELRWPFLQERLHPL